MMTRNDGGDTEIERAVMTMMTCVSGAMSVSVNSTGHQNVSVIGTVTGVDHPASVKETVVIGTPTIQIPAAVWSRIHGTMMTARHMAMQVSDPVGVTVVLRTVEVDGVNQRKTDAGMLQREAPLCHDLMLTMNPTLQQRVLVGVAREARVAVAESARQAQ
mmetsp:Transcript_128820/g.222584  ORF Transcript_128820/g.222584 Transcript_128820/m.222584 type:complete len:160 (+) Transcript_128820:2059-2538(+)